MLILLWFPSHRNHASPLFPARSLRRVRRENVSPADILRLMKQPRGDSRSAVRSADYMAQTLRLLHDRVHRVHKRSLNATGQPHAALSPAIVSCCVVKHCKVLSYVCCPPDLLPREDLEVLSKISGCAARVSDPPCRTIQNLHKYRTATSVCNNL